MVEVAKEPEKSSTVIEPRDGWEVETVELEWHCGY
jgi:hypothetical protein